MRPDDSPADAIALAQSLLQAQQQFAQAQAATGAGAAEISGQEQVANQPIREGLEIASRLAMSGQDSGAKTPETTDGGSSTGDRKETADEAHRKAEAIDTGANSKSGQTGETVSNDLGTGFVPSSAEVTAKQIAGPEANAAAEKIAAMIKGEGKARERGGEG